MKQTSDNENLVGLEPPCELPLKRNRLLIVGTGAIGVSYLPGWCTAIRQWYKHDIQVMLTQSAQQLVSAKAIAVTSGNPTILAEVNSCSSPKVLHKELSEWADLVIVAPATLNFISRLALLISDSLPVYTALLTCAPVVIAPSIPEKIYQINVTKNYISLIKARGCHVLEASTGIAVSDGAINEGAMPNIYQVLLAANSALKTASKPSNTTNI